MTKALRAFPGTGVVAIFDEAPGGGDILDINSPRNRPALNPGAWLANVYFHSSLDNMEVLSDTTVTLAHAAIAAAPAAGTTGTTAQTNFDLAGSKIDWAGVTHSLGYEPLALVAIGTNLMTPGYPVQISASTSGSARYVTPYVSTTELRFHEFQSRGTSGLGGTSVSYRVILFKQPPAPSGSKLADYNQTTGILQLARARFNSGRRYLQVVPGGTPFGLLGGRNIDLQNGGYRIARADGTTYDPVPNTTSTRIFATGTQFSSDSGVPWSLPNNYTGSFVPGTIIQVQAP